jgi:hypothetical protein
MRWPLRHIAADPARAEHTADGRGSRPLVGLKQLDTTNLLASYQHRQYLMWIPELVYERLPPLYAGSGLACAAVAQLEGPAMLSAVALWAAAGLTYGWRRVNRNAPLVVRTPLQRRTTTRPAR